MLSRLRLICLGTSILSGMISQASAASLITGTINDSMTVAVAGERSSLLAGARDLGRLSDGTFIPHAMLVLKRPAAQQVVFDRLVHDQQDAASPRYHQWLRADQLRQFGPDEADIATVAAWLRAHGLVVNGVSRSGMSMDVAGRPGAFGAAFHTELHTVKLANGETHTANITDLAIPEALSPVVRGITLSNFFPRPAMHRITPPAMLARTSSGNRPRITTGGYQGVGPGDFAVIYNETALFKGRTAAGKITGAGVTVAVVEETDILPQDWATFRKAFGLAQYRATLRLQHPGGCTDPGMTSDEGEAALDAEWANATAPGADIIEAACASTTLTFGVETALQGLVDHATKATVFSVSYGGLEQESSSSFLASWANLNEEANSEGITVMVSTGDSGSSYNRNAIAIDGVAVNGLSTNPYVTAVGGTDFYDSALGVGSTYFRAANGPNFVTAISYVPEIPWDNSCAGSIISKYEGYDDGIASCNDPNNPANVQNGVGGTGGESTVYAKPDFQNNGLPGMPADGMRDNPDVSLFASNGFWNHFLVLCMSDPNEGGTTCDYTNQNDIYGNAAGGTSFAAPAFAGVAALIVQRSGGALGNINSRLYALAQTQFTNRSMVTFCNSTRGNKSGASCVFHNVTAGDIAEPCYATSGDCYSNKEAAPEGIGVLRNDDEPSENAYPAGQGYNLATGLGTVNVKNLVTSY
jgi:subtilase family serine protease